MPAFLFVIFDKIVKRENGYAEGSFNSFNSWLKKKFLFKIKTRKRLMSTSCEFCLYPVGSGAGLFFRLYFLNSRSFWFLLSEVFRKAETCHVEEFVERRNRLHQT